MLASVYSYRVMVKSVSSCCVRGRWVLSNPVTNMVMTTPQNVHKLMHSNELISLDLSFVSNLIYLSLYITTMTVSL